VLDALAMADRNPHRGRMPIRPRRETGFSGTAESNHMVDAKRRRLNWQKVGHAVTYLLGLAEQIVKLAGLIRKL
jgi:hypothetical protein